MTVSECSSVCRYVCFASSLNSTDGIQRDYQPSSTTAQRIRIDLINRLYRESSNRQKTRIVARNTDLSLIGDLHRQVMDPKYVKMEEGEATVNFDASADLHRHYSLPASYVKSLIISWIVSTCCCWFLGGIAFILALCGQKMAYLGDVAEARRMKLASYFVSFIGFAIGLVILIIVLVHFVTFMKTLYRMNPGLLPPNYASSQP